MFRAIVIVGLLSVAACGFWIISLSLAAWRDGYGKGKAR